MPPGVLPFLMIGIALLITYAFFRLNTTLVWELIGEILVAMGTIWILVLSVLIFVSVFCMDIHPTEKFANPIDETEAAVCKLKEAVRTFVASELGQPGQDDPSLIVRAMDVGAPLSDCTKAVPLPLEERLTRMERTLDQLAEPVLKRTYDKTMTCEGFGPIHDPDTRLKAINAKLQRLTKQYLDPLLQNQSDLQKGIVSDCNKRRGASAAIAK